MPHSKIKIVPLIAVLLIFLILPAYSLSTRDGIIDEKVIIDPSVKYIHYHRNLPSGAGVELHVIKIRLNDPSLEIRPALEGGKIKSSAELHNIAKAEGAIAAINGGFFFDQGGRKLPVGELIINGGLYSHSDFHRGSLVVRGSGKISFEVETIDAFLNPSDYYEPIRIHAMNVPPGGMADAVHLYNRFWGDTTPAGDGVEIQVENGVVIGHRIGGGTKIPENGYIISLRGAWGSAASRFTDGLKVGIIYEFQGEDDPVQQWLTAGPLFMIGGWPRDFSDEYSFSSNVLASANRSCLCLTFNNELLFITTRGAGLTFGQLSSLLADLNIQDAIGLDGGGSAGMWADGLNLPAPSRAVPNAVILTKVSDTGGPGIKSGGLWGK